MLKLKWSPWAREWSVRGKENWLVSWDRLPEFGGTNGIPSRGQVVPKVGLSELGFHGPKCSCWLIEPEMNSLPGCSETAFREMMDGPPDPIHNPDVVDPKGWWALPSNPKHVFSIFLGGKVPGKLTSPLDGHLMSIA